MVETARNNLECIMAYVSTLELEDVTNDENYDLKQ